VTDKIVEMTGLRTYFFTRRGTVRAVDGTDLSIEKGQIFGLAGESGSGKTVTALSIMRLVPPPGRIVAGKILFCGEDLLQKGEDSIRKVRGSRISLVFQDPTSSLNPVLTAGEQVREAITAHQKRTKSESEKMVTDIFESISIADPSTRVHNYPHQLSGGMRQRVMIAMAISCSPYLIIADEPTTNLDVTVQAQVLSLLKSLRERLCVSILLITHDLGVMAETTDSLAVMYGGQIVECGSTKEMFKDPAHPYTEALLAAVPRRQARGGRLRSIPGEVPDLINPPSGCRFHPRCKYAIEICKKEEPRPIEYAPGHFSSCHLTGSLSLQSIVKRWGC
jgi:oligopeptide/dipeptide ABC transporter ATP-binding protein